MGCQAAQSGGDGDGGRCAGESGDDSGAAGVPHAQVALEEWRAAKDAEAQVAHWLVEGRATRKEFAQ